MESLPAMPMDASEVESLIRKWLEQERMEIRNQEDKRAHAHFLVRYPSGRNGHVFAIILPKDRDLVAISSMTRVDGGQQEEMSSLMKEDEDRWQEWIHDCRMQLMQTGVDWVIHLGHKNKEKIGPLQAFNTSEPIWYDGITKNEFMQTFRRLWLAKLGVIHEIKFTFGPGSGKNGPVDDWEKKKSTESQKTSSNKPTKRIEMDDSMSFGSDFDPSDWV